jgi:tripartite-type tricarboxylate transporter receptor subunit TctC
MAAPPGTPADRVAALRKALADTFKDPAYIEEAKKLEFDVNPVSAERMSKIVSEAYATPVDIQKRLQGIITSN